MYREIAKNNGVSMREVKGEMQAAIDDVYSNPNAQALKIPRQDKIPTIDEFVKYAVKQLENDK